MKVKKIATYTIELNAEEGEWLLQALHYANRGGDGELFPTLDTRGDEMIQKLIDQMSDNA